MCVCAVCAAVTGMADEEGRTPAHIAASTGHVDALRALVEELISPAPSSSSSSSSSDKTINDTKTEGDEEAADKQASSPSAGAGAGGGGGGGAKLPPPGLGLVLVKDAAGCFPAHFAAKGGHTECLQYIHGLSTVSSLGLPHAQRLKKSRVLVSRARLRQYCLSTVPSSLRCFAFESDLACLLCPVLCVLLSRRQQTRSKHRTAAERRP